MNDWLDGVVLIGGMEGNGIIIGCILGWVLGWFCDVVVLGGSLI